MDGGDDGRRTRLAKAGFPFTFAGRWESVVPQDGARQSSTSGAPSSTRMYIPAWSVRPRCTDTVSMYG